jgi:hypothetical protein
MNAGLRRRFEMATRVRDFLRAHRTEGAEATALARLEELLERAEVLAAQQRAGVVATRAATEQRAEVRRALQGMLEKATARKELLVARGMSEKLLEDLSAAVDEFDKTLEATRAGRRDHVGASADLRAVATEITEQVRLLDGLVRYRFGDDPELMGAWASARNVLGPFKSRGEDEAGADETPGVIEPAA